MSDARPITNITDFVCSSCWNGFSRSDPGVVRGDQIFCPHCGAVLETDNADEQLAQAVLSAPRVDKRDSAEFETHNFRDTSEVAAQALQQPGRAWLPPDALEPSTDRDAARATDSDDFDDSFGSGVLVGDPDHDFSTAERTLSGTQDNDALLEAVRQTSPIPKAYIVGDELSVAIEEPTPVDLSAIHDEGMGLLEEPLPEADLAHRDWKLKAMGITYNFHGLDPLFSWAANKSGQPMSLSHDGETWKDFHTFYAAIRDGVSVKKAFEQAPDPANAPPPPATPRVTRTINQLRPELPELEGLRPAPELGKDLSPAHAPSTSSQLAARPSSTSTNQPRPANVPTTLGPTGQPSATNLRSASGTTARNQATLSPATSPSKRMPVAAVEEKPLFTPVRIALLVVVALIAVAAGLHLSGLFKIPGLP